MKKLLRYNSAMTFIVVGYLFFSPLLTASGFLKDQFWRDEMKYLIDIVHKDHWTIAYAYGGLCSEEKRAGAKELEAQITRALRIWLQPLREIETQTPIVDDFRYEQYDDITPEVRAKAGIDFFVKETCEKGRSSASTAAKFPPLIAVRSGNSPMDYIHLGIIVHESGHTFGLGDTYVGRGELEPSVNKGGIAETIGTQPASIMGFHLHLHTSRFIGEDDENGIVWLYKVRHEGLALNDCFFPDYVFEKSPDGCVPKSPLIFEVKQGHLGYALRVLEDDANIDINAQDERGSTALHYAIKLEISLVIEALFSRDDLDVNVADKLGLTVLHYAVMDERIDMVETLLKRKDLNVNGRDERGKTPLHYAISEDRLGIVNLLLGHGDILVHLKDNGGQTPVSLARENGRTRLAKELLAHPNYALSVSSHRKLATTWGSLKVR